jgi:hypothetical protein
MTMTFAIALMSGSLASCSAPASSHQASPVVWMETSRPFCIGRFALKLPGSMQSRGQKYTYNGDELVTSPGTSLSRFHDVVERRERKLLQDKRIDNSGGARKQTEIPWLEKALQPHPDARLFAFRGSNNEGFRLGYETEGYVWNAGTMFLLKSNAAEGMVDAVFADDADKMQRIKARDNGVVPTEAGYCFDGGLITGGTKFHELATAYFERPSTPGCAIFGIEMRPNLPSDDKLLDRVPKLMQMMGNLASNTRTLRRGDRPLAGLDGQEMLTKISADGVTAYYFIWEAKGEPKSVTHPNTHIELRLGGELNTKTEQRDSSTLSEQEALGLWDDILNSFHLRPGAV